MPLPTNVLSPAPGTVAGFQLVAVPKSPTVPGTHVWSTASAGRAPATAAVAAAARITAARCWCPDRRPGPGPTADDDATN